MIISPFITKGCHSALQTCYGVLYGDSITDGLYDSGEFDNLSLKLWHNGGVPGQRISLILDRWQADVIDYQPAIVIVSAGTNDVVYGGSVDPQNYMTIINNIVSFGCRGVYLTIPENTTYTQSQLDSERAFNTWLLENGPQYGTVIDYCQWSKDHSELMDEHRVHPLVPDGYNALAKYIWSCI